MFFSFRCISPGMDQGPASRNRRPSKPQLSNFNNPRSSRYVTICLTASSTLVLTVSILISAFSGSSYGALMPVNSEILPSRAFLYRPFGSRFSASSTGMSTKTSMKGRGSSSGWAGEGVACSSRAVWRSFR